MLQTLEPRSGATGKSWKIPREMVWSACVQWFYSNLAGYVKCGAFSTMKFLWTWMKLDRLWSPMTLIDSYVSDGLKPPKIQQFLWYSRSVRVGFTKAAWMCHGGQMVLNHLWIKRTRLAAVLICGFFLQYSVGPLTSRYVFFLSTWRFQQLPDVRLEVGCIGDTFVHNISLDWILC